MENNERFRGLEETMSDMLIEMNQVNERLERLERGQQDMIGAFNRFGTAMIDKLSELTDEVKGMRSELKQMQDHEDRLRKIEQVVFKRGA